MTNHLHVRRFAISDIAGSLKRRHKLQNTLQKSGIFHSLYYISFFRLFYVNNISSFSTQKGRKGEVMAQCSLTLNTLLFVMFSNFAGASHAHCPHGWNLLGEECYYFSSDRLTWLDGQSYCLRHGGKLLEVSDDQAVTISY